MKITQETQDHRAIKAGRRIVERKPKPRHVLHKLLAQCKPSTSRRKQNREWLNAKPVGRELI